MWVLDPSAERGRCFSLSTESRSSSVPMGRAGRAMSPDYVVLVALRALPSETVKRSRPLRILVMFGPRGEPTTDGWLTRAADGGSECIDDRLPPLEC
jgi:hypothetical protein